MQQEVRQLAPQPFGSREFRDALGSFATGVTVITSQGDGHPYGMTANAFSSVSLDPPLVLVCVISGTEGCASIQRNGVFAVNILGADHEPISRHFASRDRPRGVAGFRDIPHEHGETGCPVLKGVAAHMDCRLASSHEAGDHDVLIGEVLSISMDPGVRPLVFHRGSYAYLRDE